VWTSAHNDVYVVPPLPLTIFTQVICPRWAPALLSLFCCVLLDWDLSFWSSKYVYKLLLFNW